MQSQIVILDAGSQYGKLIDRSLRSLGVISDILPLNTTMDKLKRYKGIIISGSPNSVIADIKNFDIKILKCGIPILGICYGMQLINYFYGGEISNTVDRTDGQIEVFIDNNSLLFNKLDHEEKVLLTHGDSIIKKPHQFRIISKSFKKNVIYGMEWKNIYGIQFHPEVNLTVNGNQIFKNFIYLICNCLENYNLEDKYQNAMNYIRETIGNKHVLSFVSGGVDSTVCTALLFKALSPDKVHAIHVDNGFMRHQESKLVEDELNSIGFNLQVIDASQNFYKNIGDETDPEKIRKTIGDTFIKLIDGKINSNYILAQGTLRPDLIESASEIASSNASVIKTHHNDSAMVRLLREKGQIIEPLKDYHKDEVREIGRKLGLSSKLVDRHPFPGPGLAIRIICDKYDTNYDVVNKKLDIFRDKDMKIKLLPIRSVGVQGDGRSYNYVCAINTFIGWNELIELSKEIVQKIKEINRVIYIFGTNIDQIEYINTKLDEPSIELLRRADRIAQNLLEKDSKISQMPIILLPLGINNNRSIVIRTIITDDFMTGLVANPEQDLKNINVIVDKITQIDGISHCAYDLTSKPPGTTEWL